ncbi:uncharacterized protein LOC143221437, partial [Lasioglossum baleicum]|uniref:uncharacterized protein LOC143221437 n=1 Tax=Lasioglossum baleicum TaxID=434251 RepID=UPI003FCEB635
MHVDANVANISVLRIDSSRALRSMESTLTEFEENLSFDIDDPDFAPLNPRTIAQNVLRSVQFTDITFGVNKRWTRNMHSLRDKNLIYGQNWIHVDISFLPEKSISSR